MRKLTDTDLVNIAGSTVQGYRVDGVRIKRGPFTDSDHYGILLCRSLEGNYVTWQFHLDENEKVNPYYGHYFMAKRVNAIRDFHIRDLEGSIELSTDYWDCERKIKNPVKPVKGFLSLQQTFMQAYIFIIDVETGASTRRSCDV